VVKVPTLDEVLQDLSELSGKEVEGSLTVKDLGVDSLELAEWAYSLQERLDVVIEDDRLEELLALPIAGIYEHFLREAGVQPPVAKQAD
jgi:acyl carrier protein